MAHRILFILKRRHHSGGHHSHWSSGLYNSSMFVAEMLRKNGIQSEVVQVTDNNDIDREVAKFKPAMVVIEALWVVPEKFEVLSRLHPSVEWIVRCHSEAPFIAMEGIAVDWFTRYVEFPKVYIAANSLKSEVELKALLPRHQHKVLVLPNYYPISELRRPPARVWENTGTLEIACLGAIRPLKNQLIQAIAAISAAKRLEQKLLFHINASRPEQGGEEVLKNMRALFKAHGQTLVEHDWVDHDDFVQLLTQMDVSMCVSLSETFCIIAADSIAAGIPTVMSDAIPWAQGRSLAPKSDVLNIENVITEVLLNPGLVTQNRGSLHEYSVMSAGYWFHEIRRLLEG